MKVFIMGFLGILLSATVAFAADCTQRFSWLPNTEAGIAGYKIHYGLTDGGSYPNTVDIVDPTPVDGRILYDVSGLTCDEYYYFVATAYNSADRESDPSPQVELFVAFATDCTQRFSWLPNTEADIAGYKIHYGLTDGGSYPNTVDIVDPTPVDGRILYDVSGLTCDEYYYFVATAYNSADLESDPSPQVELFVTTVGDPRPTIISISFK